jgi:hypothetical protein
VKEQVGWASHSYHIVIQHRGWVDVKTFAPLRAATEAFSLSCFLEELRTLRDLLPPEQSILVYITSDQASAIPAVAAHLSGLPNVTCTSSSLFDNLHSGKNSAQHPLAYTENMGLVDWFLVGDAAAALCTGTTYCISARGRTGVGRSDWGLVQGRGQRVA